MTGRLSLHFAFVSSESRRDGCVCVCVHLCLPAHFDLLFENSKILEKKRKRERKELMSKMNPSFILFSITMFKCEFAAKIIMGV